ncbi:MAG: PadR family transcriptional regulator [Promethearchaeota archaeon]
MGSQIRSINPLRRFQKISILVKILYYARKDPFYGSWLKKKLIQNDYNISDGTLYPWLNRLTFSGLLSFEKRNVEGKIRKYYSLTEFGKKHFDKIKEYLRELYDEIID